VKTYEITITVVTEGTYREMDTDAKWVADMLTSKSPVYQQEAWVESVEKVGDYDVRDPEPYEWPAQPETVVLPSVPRDKMTWLEWDALRLNDIMILDPDGFDRGARDCMTRLYTLDEFLTRRDSCTIMSTKPWRTTEDDDDGWQERDDEPFENREGDPAFNGAFNKW